LRLDGENRLGEYNERELFRVLLEEPMHGLIDGGRETLCIVIDGLDEAGTAEENLLAETLGRYMPLLPPWLRVLVTGRPVAAVAQPLGSGLHLSLSGQSQENLADVRQYFERTLRDCCAGTPDWEASLDELTSRSHGIFLYAELVCQGIQAGKLTLTDWDEFPDGLQNSFTSWFQWFFPDKREFEDRFALPLGALCALAEPLPLEELRRVFSWGEAQLHRFLRRIDVLLEHGESVFGKETVTLSHKYIGEWLTDSQVNSLYFASTGDAKGAMAQAFYGRFRQDPKELTEFESLHLCDLLRDCGKTAQLREAVCSNVLYENILKAGDHCRDWGHLDEAMGCYRCGLAVAELGENLPDNLDVLRHSCIYDNRIGKLEQMMGNLSAAQEWYEKALTIQEHLAETCGTPGNRRGLGVCYLYLGDLAHENGNLQAARKWYEKFLAVAERLAETYGTAKDLRTLSISYGRLGLLAREDGNRQIARNWYEKNLVIAEQLAEARGTPGDLWDLSVSYERQGDLAQEDGDSQMAWEWYEKTLTIREQLVEARNTPGNLRALSVCYEKLGDLMLKDRNLSVAQDWYKKDLAIAEQLVKTRGTPGDFWDLSVSYERQGNFARECGDRQTAWNWYKKTLTILKQLVETRGAPKEIRSLSIIYNKLGDLAQMDKDRQAARTWHEKAISIQRWLVEAHGTPKDLRDLSISYGRLGNLALADEDLQTARIWYEKAIPIQEQLAKSRSTPRDLRDLSVSYSKLGATLQAEGDLQKATIWYEKALLIAEQLTKVCLLQ
ncbi:MAG: hypothetical protein LUG17_02040, partial [Clostridiales bacterium]|nr:hypothetical protein [Clostridiales bacterium]